MLVVVFVVVPIHGKWRDANNYYSRYKMKTQTEAPQPYPTEKKDRPKAFAKQYVNTIVIS